jgi:NAD(P)H dehydrogenase (quinone)
MLHNGFHIAAPSVAIAYHSRFGHTAVLADAVSEGAREAGADVSIIALEAMTDSDWDILDNADSIIVGSATYMGNVSAGFQAFAEQTGRRCVDGTWRDKVAVASVTRQLNVGRAASALAASSAPAH